MSLWLQRLLSMISDSQGLATRWRSPSSSRDKPYVILYPAGRVLRLLRSLGGINITLEFTKPGDRWLSRTCNNVAITPLSERTLRVVTSPITGSDITTLAFGGYSEHSLEIISKSSKFQAALRFVGRAGRWSIIG